MTQPLTLLADHCLLTGQPTFASAILSGFGLSDIYTFVGAKNPSEKAPYHGAIHEACVVVAAYEGAVFFNIARDEMVQLLIAAAMHDFNHYGCTPRATPIPDAENIKRALVGLDLVEQQVKFDLTVARRLVASTEYPYKREPTDLLEAILRDADLTMIYTNNDLMLTLFHGLYKELKLNKPDMTYTEFANGIGKFYTNTKPHTVWGKKLRVLYNFNARVNNLVTLLKDNPLETA